MYFFDLLMAADIRRKPSRGFILCPLLFSARVGNFRKLQLVPIPRERRPSLSIQNGRRSQNRHEFQQRESIFFLNILPSYMLIFMTFRRGLATLCSDILHTLILVSSLVSSYHRTVSEGNSVPVLTLIDRA